MNYITEKERLENEIGSLKIQNDFLQSQITDLLLERTDLRKRLSHLLESDFINSFDVVDFKTGKYKRDIKEADKIARPIVHAHWIDSGYNFMNCSNCKTALQKERMPYARYCLYCGAKMDGVENG